MTMQIRDSFSFQNKECEAIALSRKLKIFPKLDFGVKTSAFSTSNYRGFHCDYVIDGELIVKNLYIYSEHNDYPIINNVRAVPDPFWVDIRKKTGKERLPVPVIYYGINFKDKYSGKMLIGIGLHPDLHKSQRYDQILELEFSEGVLQNSDDISGLWKAWAKEQKEGEGGYWWTYEDNSYHNLLNYSLMGLIDRDSNEESKTVGDQ